MNDKVKVWWSNLEQRERGMLVGGALLVCILLFYQLIWFPWHRAIHNMQNSLQWHRENLVWMRQQSELIGQYDWVSGKAPAQNKNESLMAVLGSTAKTSGVRASIKKMTPSADEEQVSIVFDEVSFNRWAKWASQLQAKDGVQIKELSADRLSEKPDLADIRVTFAR